MSSKKANLSEGIVGPPNSSFGSGLDTGQYHYKKDGIYYLAMGRRGSVLSILHSGLKGANNAGSA